MFAVGGKKYRRGYNCGNYLKNGIKGQNENRKRKRKSEYTDLGCTASHFIAEETLDQYVKTFIARVKEKLSEALAGLDVEKSIESANADRMTIRDLEKEKEGIEAQLDILAEQRIEQIAKKPNRKEQIARRYDELEEKLEAQIENIDLRITYLSDQSAKKKELKQSYEEVIKRFDELLQKPSFLKTDLNTIIREITVDDDKVVTIQLYSDITELFALAE
jgi:DNA repair exonuclease SbcCD ATPase subunit